MKKIFFLVIQILAVSGIALAQQKDGAVTFLSLQQAVEYAYQHNNNVLNADLDEQIAKAKVKETTGIGLPQISGNIDTKDYFELNYLFPGVFAGGAPGTFVGFPIKTPSYSAAAGIQASQLLFDGTYIVGLQASKTYRELSQKNLTRTKIETAVAVSKAYYNLLVNRQRLNLLDANVIRLKKLKDDTQALYDNGFVEKVDIDRVVLTYNNISVEKEKTERLLKLSEYLLKYQVGINIYSDVTLTDSLDAAQVKNISVPSEKPDVTGRIEYSLLKTQQHLQELDLKRYRYAYLPSLVLYGNLNTVAQRPKFDFTDSKQKWFPTGFVGATLTVPIFDGLQKRAQIHQAKFSLMKTKNDLEATTNALSLDASSGRTALVNAIASLTIQEQNLELANEVTRISKAKYDQGVGSNLEVINAETLLKEAQTNYYNALYDALVAKVDLDKATGNIK